MPDDKLKNLFARRLREEREWVGLSVTELAERCGYVRPVVARYEAAQRMPGLDAAVRLARALGVTVDTLVTEAPKPKRKKGR